LFAGMMVMGLIGLYLGWWGRAERRVGATSFWRNQFATQVLWTVGLIGMAAAAAWSRQELLARIPAMDFRWVMLTRGLPQVVLQSQAGFQYWQAASSLLFAVLLTGILIGGPWPPFHRGLRGMIDATLAESAPLLITAWPLVAGYAWLRFLAPAFRDDLAAIDGGLMWWTAMATIVAAWRCWTVTDLREFAAAWCLSLQSLGWLGLIDGSPAGLSAGWLMLQAAGWSTAGWLLLSDCFRTRGILASLIAGLCVLPLVTIPVWGGDATPVRAVLIHHLEPTGLALVGWFITGWAAVRRVMKLTTSSPNRSADDDSSSWAWLPLAACLTAVVLDPSWWWGQP
jgi:NADH:ubiquinone oxidoreductase subunit 4 (subunit M)